MPASQILYENNRYTIPYGAFLGMSDIRLFHYFTTRPIHPLSQT